VGSAARLSWRGAHPRPPGQNRGAGEVLGARAAAGVRAHAVGPASLFHQRGASLIRFAERRQGRKNGADREETTSAPREDDAREGAGMGKRRHARAVVADGLGRD
jgi:hypothetical protein